MEWPKYTQFLYFFIDGAFMMMSQERHKLVKKLKIYEGSDLSWSLFSFLRYSKTTESLMSFIFLFDFGLYYTSSYLTTTCLTIWPVLLSFLGEVNEDTSRGSKNPSYWVEAFFVGEVPILMYYLECVGKELFNWVWLFYLLILY